MGAVTCHRWNRAAGNSVGPQPTRAMLSEMLDELTVRLRETGMRPVALETQSWSRPTHIPAAFDNDFLAQIRLEVEPGEMPRSFRSWFQWRHPRWNWSGKPFPAGRVLLGELT